MKLLRCLVPATLLCCLSALVSAQSYPPEWSATSKYAVGDQVQLNGNVVRAVKPVTAAGKYVYSSWELWEVRANTNLLIGVGQTFANLPAAWAYMANARVADGAYLHLYIATTKQVFNETFTAPFSLDHAFGARISLIGDVQNNISLTFPGDGFSLDSGHSFALISGLNVVGVPTDTGTGLPVKGNSTVGNISHTYFNGFPVGIASVQGSSVTLDNTAGVSNCSNTMIFADTNGTVVCGAGSTFSGNGTTTIALQAAFGGVIIAHGADFSFNDIAAEALEGGIIDIEASQCETTNQVAISATMHSHVDAAGVDFKTGSPTDIDCETGSTVEVTGGNPHHEIIDNAQGAYIYGP